MIDKFLFSFIPLFVAFDALGILPIYLQLTRTMAGGKRNKHLRDSILTAFVITLLFVVVGNRVMTYLGISLQDFLVAGGVILFAIAAKDIVTGHSEQAPEGDTMGVVPLGVPLLAGPAVLATSIIIRNEYDFWYFLVSLVLNLMICAAVLRCSDYIVRYLGPRFIDAISKVFSLIIASIAVMFIRRGLQGQL
jgi:multiple antibiotic resistance protein